MLNRICHGTRLCHTLSFRQVNLYGELVAAGQRAMAASIGTRAPGTPMMWGFGPAPDGEVLLQQPFQPDFADISSDVPLMIGTTFNELQRRVYGTPMTLDEAKAQLKPTFGDRVDEYVAAFAEAWPDYTPQDLLSVDMMFRPKTLITADAVATTRKAPTWMYMFTWKSPADQGSVHGYELNFCFNTPELHGRVLPEPSEADRRLAENMSRSWPISPSRATPTWKAFRNGSPTRRRTESASFSTITAAYGPTSTVPCRAS